MLKEIVGYMADHVIVTPLYSFGYKMNFFIYDNVGVGPNSFISATNAKFIVKGDCDIAEKFTVHTRNHAQVIGKFITEINEQNKPKGYDMDVIIEKDLWIGYNVTLLAGIIVGRGRVIAAGAVVNKDLPPYSVAGGVPARFIEFKWTIAEILEHDNILYPDAERLSREYLEEIFEKFA